ncbi:MAG: sel1 repeat family protein [Candidatus Methanomethylophilus sp.]|nr:sel1 repeat family protein [Methanomethylophilus sp.]
MHYTGKGTPKDSAKAAHWYSKAAENGHPDAMYNLGLLLMEGDGIGQDYKQAMELFGRAAELGVEDAADALKLVRKQLGV